MTTITLGPAGSRYRIHDPGGGGRFARILRTGVPYESDVVEDMRTLGASGVAVDVGANLGNHSLWLAVVCGLKVEAFEPIKLEGLYANIALNGLEDRITVYPLALGADQGRAKLIGKGRLDPGSAGEFEVRSLDSFDFDDVSILKIDVEGMESHVIRGGMATIERNRPVVYAEAWDDEYRARIDALLRPLGYTHSRSFRWHQNRWTP